MRITESMVAMVSQHSLVEQEVQSESLKTWGDGIPAAVVDISAAARQLAAEPAPQPISRSQETTAVSFELSDKDKQKIELLQRFIESLTGKKFKFVLPENYKIQQTGNSNLSAVQTGSGSNRDRVGWGLEYYAYSRRSEQESVSFNAAGVVKTADGREISMDLSFSLSRQFVSEQQISLKAGDALIDPLVINFAASAAKLTATKYSFDLDSDGTSDQVSFAGAGSGFLALDVNKDGVINNGSELFGPQSGDGFGELAAFDSDGNNWIDENDAIYDKLRIWTKDEQGRDQLFALGQKGIGAIYVGNVATEFALKDSVNNLQGQMRSTGIFLRENGMAGTIQHIDLAV